VSRIDRPAPRIRPPSPRNRTTPSSPWTTTSSPWSTPCWRSSLGSRSVNDTRPDRTPASPWGALHFAPLRRTVAGKHDRFAAPFVCVAREDNDFAELDEHVANATSAFAANQDGFTHRTILKNSGAIDRAGFGTL